MKKPMIVFLSLLVACTMISPGWAADERSEKVEIIVPYPIPEIQKLADAYQEQFGSMVVITAVTDENPKETEKQQISLISQRVKSDNPPDLVFMPYFSAALPGLPLDSFLDLSVLGLDLFPNAANSWQQEDSLRSVPWEIDTQVLLVNDQVLEQCGLSYPEHATLNDLTEICLQASKLTDAAIYGAEQFQNNVQAKTEINIEGYTYLDPIKPHFNYQEQSFVSFIRDYKEFSAMLQTVKVSGTAVATENVNKMNDGQLLFARCRLSEIASFNENDHITVYPMPTSGGMVPYTVNGSFSVPVNGNNQAALDFLNYVYGDAQNLVSIPSTVAAWETKSSDSICKILSAADTPSYYHFRFPNAWGSYEGSFRYPFEKRNDSILDGYRWNMYQEMNQWAKDFQGQTESQWVRVLTIFLTICLLAIFAVDLFLIGAAIHTLIHRSKEISNINRQKYGRMIDIINGKEREAFVVSFLGLIFVVGLFMYLPHAADFHSSISLRIRRLFLYILIGGGLFLTINALASALLSKIHLCERAMVIVTGFKVQVIYADSIERITSDAKSTTIVTNYSKPTVLRNAAYKQLAEKLNEWKGKWIIDN